MRFFFSPTFYDENFRPILYYLNLYPLSSFYEEQCSLLALSYNTFVALFHLQELGGAEPSFIPSGIQLLARAEGLELGF